MPRACTVCSHPERVAIDKALVAGESLRGISRNFFGSVKAEDALARHKAEHVPARMIKAQERQDVRQAIDIVQQLKAINSVCWQVLQDARASHDHELELKAADRLFRHIELQAKLIGELEQEGTVNVTINAQWLEIRAVLIDALRPYPDAAAAVAAALLEVAA